MDKEKESNILKEAADIIYERKDRDERPYGDFFENMEEAATMASLMSRKTITAEDAYHVLISLKFVRESNFHKYDNLLDAIGYIASLCDYKDHKKEEDRITGELNKKMR